MKKGIITFLVIYLLIGAIWFFWPKDKDDNIEVNTSNEKNTTINNFSLRWVVNNNEAGNYTPPYWLEKKDLSKYVKNDELGLNKAMSPTEKLMTFFVQAQLGDTHIISSFINSVKISKDLKRIINR